MPSRVDFYIKWPFGTPKQKSVALVNQDKVSINDEATEIPLYIDLGPRKFID